MTSGVGIRSGLLLAAAIEVIVCDWPPPAVMPDRLIVCGPAFSRIGAGLGIGSSVGATLTGVMVIVRVAAPRLLIAAPSLAVNVTVIGARSGGDGLVLLLE